MHATTGATKIPAWEMIRFSVNIMRGCFGGCTFCSITEHEGRIIQSRSRRFHHPAGSRKMIRDKVRSASPASSVTSAAPRPTCTAWAASSPEIEAACRKPSCVYPDASART
jgi:radical SAM superfamily enzyme YgiQ (UPF0313 family)